MEKDGKVFAVEPDPLNLEILKHNIRLNRLNYRIQTFGFAISNENSLKEFAFHVKST